MIGKFTVTSSIYYLVIEKPDDFVAIKSSSSTVNFLEMLMFRKKQIEETTPGEPITTRKPNYLHQKIVR